MPIMPADPIARPALLLVVLLAATALAFETAPSPGPTPQSEGVRGKAAWPPRERLGSSSPAAVKRPAPSPGGRNAFPGPVKARVLRVVDGDTLVAEAVIWPGHVVTATVRLRGIDAPEMRSKCPEEQQNAADARDALAALVGQGPVKITNISAGKYYGRVLADVETADGRGVSDDLLAHRLVRPYSGGRRQSWCN